MSDHLDCGDCLDRLAEFLDKDFDPALAAQLSTHLEECAGCSKTRVEDALVQKVRDCQGHGTAPPSLRERIIERIEP